MGCNGIHAFSHSQNKFLWDKMFRKFGVPNKDTYGTHVKFSRGAQGIVGQIRSQGKSSFSIWIYCGFKFSTFWPKFSSYFPAVTLKIRSRSQTPNQFSIMSKHYIHADFS